MKKFGSLKQIMFLFLMFIAQIALFAQESGDLRLVEWEPKSQMIVKEAIIMKPKFPVIDIHNNTPQNWDHWLNWNKLKTNHKLMHYIRCRL